jgi:hypothetical protein
MEHESSPLDRMTIKGWEDSRFERETAAAIAALPVVDEPPVSPEVVTAVPKHLCALRGRMTSGLGVQLLIEPFDSGRAWITVCLNGKTETFEVYPADANEAFEHPYAYGATLAL